MRDDRSLLPPAIEEGLRCEPPLLSIGRTATCDVELGGALIEAGDVITPHIGSANHDETRWTTRTVRHLPAVATAHRLRTRAAHVPRHAPGAPRDPGAAQSRVFDRLDNLELQLDAGDPHIRGDVFRSPTALPVTFTPAA